MTATASNHAIWSEALVRRFGATTELAEVDLAGVDLAGVDLAGVDPGSAPS